jgi:twitching motility protein PilT
MKGRGEVRRSTTESLERYRLRNRALQLKRFTAAELGAVAGVSAGTAHHFVKELLRQQPACLSLESPPQGTSNTTRGVGRPARRYSLTRRGMERLAEANLGVAAQLNELAFRQDPSLRPRGGRRGVSSAASDRVAAGRHPVARIGTAISTPDLSSAAAGAGEGRSFATGGGVSPAFAPALGRIAAEFEQLVDDPASALYFGAGQPTLLRVGRQMERAADPHVWTTEELRSLTNDLLTPWQKRRLNLRGALACTYRASKAGPISVRVYKEGGGVGLEVRRPPTQVPSIDDLHLPAQVGRFCTLHSGFVFVSGPIASGRIRALAAMMDHINRDRSIRMISIEEPTVFSHQNKKSVVSQRQVGFDTPDFATGVREALKENVDVLVVSELSDHRTVEMALDASKRALVLCRIDAPDLAEGVETIVQLLPADEQRRGRITLADQLMGGISFSPRSLGRRQRAVTIVEPDEKVRRLIADAERTALRRQIVDRSIGSVRAEV